MIVIRVLLLFVSAVLLASAAWQSVAPGFAVAGAVCAFFAAVFTPASWGSSHRARNDADDLPELPPLPPLPPLGSIVSIEHTGPRAYRRAGCPHFSCIQPVDCRAAGRCMSLPIKRINP